ncbi:glycosyl transferase family 2 [Viridibacillus sp. FSL H7-0596]|uniref:glycosyltransferase n=1 Tax=Viridibacillus sp. FSL H7-0596 TaxID=1928923 RepID=UPI00096E90E7|nr:glycosyltransferase [Viridibacillus sp. FSL H7-0596]OMC85752.1 glycosyl transferase family 2 [Viridibacillus sp. FSL H7-0596]
MKIANLDEQINQIKSRKELIENAIKKEKYEINHLLVNCKLPDNIAMEPISLFNDETDTSIKMDKEEYLSYREEVADFEYFESIKPLLEMIPDSNGSRYYQKYKVNVGIIADEFLYQSYKDVANFYPITFSNYKNYKSKLDILLVVSTWKGLDKAWEGLGNPSSRKREEAHKIIHFFKKNKVQTVFYSKEDPVNYEAFIGLARKCEYVFTTAVEKIESYQKDCRHNNIFVLEFGVNPLYHNPIGIKNIQKSSDVFFAGSWLNKYPERQKETIEIFDGVIKANRRLKIVDRNFQLNKPNYFFPSKYLQYSSPAIEHEYLQKVHKLYDWSINLNSIKFSETMFANRIYELQAIGNIIISNYSVGVNDKFPNVFLVNDRNELKDILNGFTNEEVYKHQVVGIRNVMSSHTTFERFNYLLDCIGFNRQLYSKKVLVVANLMSDDVIRDFENQTYVEKHLITEADFDEKVKKDYDFIAFFNSKYNYQEYYLEDMINGFKYTNSDYIAKNSYYHGSELVEGLEHAYINEMTDKYKTVFWSEAFQANELLNMKQKQIRENGYCIDHFEINTAFKNDQLESDVRTYELSVIVPVFNNGKYLLNKCFNSLKRSSIFEMMEIIIIDDGSSKKETIATINRIAREHPNVVTYFYREGGSGSASRARNKGAELATTEYVTYLDPDNEAVNDGYDKLLNILKNNTEIDIAIGNMIKLNNSKIGNFKYFETVINACRSDIINDPKKLLMDTDLRTQSIQALVVKREIIINNNLRMVENAGGQDTLFFQELLLHSSKGAVIDKDIHIYYAAVSGSVTNTVTKAFFEKYYTLEKERLPFLIKNDLLDLYMERRFNFYFRNWYLIRIKKIKHEEQQEAIDTLYKIYSLYKEYKIQKSVDIEKFAALYEKRKYKQIIKYFSSMN